jgi:hypothetical protein
LALLFGSNGNASAAPAGSCSALEQQLGECHTSGTSDGRGVDVAGSIEREHKGSRAGESSAGGAGRALTDDELLALLDDACYGNAVCDVRGAFALNPLIPAQPATPGAAGVPAATVTISDLARFLPATATLHAEPNGWAAVGVPANFWADATAVTVSGSLLGDTAQVRFTPQAYRFDYGDGSARSSTRPGASWASLGQEELTATSTSHVYRSRGDRRASVTVVYSAQYRLADGPWISVTGAVSGTTPPQRVLVVAERTALTTPA